MTKKVGTAGRFGARYGRKVRNKVTRIEKKQFKKQECPYCGLARVKRVSLGIYLCSRCNARFTGRAYTVK